MWIRTARGVRLAGELHGDGDSVIVMAHGFCSDRRSRGRFDRLAKDFTGLGFSVLTFDFSGCGESEPDVVTVANEVEDLRAVIGHVRARGFRRVALHGHSLGGSVCLAAYDKDIRTMVLSGAATGPMRYTWSEYYSAEQLRELDETGFMRDGKHLLSRQTLEDFEERDQERLLGPVECPLLLIHGDGDEEERELLDRSRQATLPEGSRLAVVAGAGHSFTGYMDELSALACAWYQRHLR
ncbi:alpha/beta hydrolase family protein [Actinocrispum wychmicini]|uniref:Alpha-beta hydrolase superfamily lysophospholipase n=1 Tax=Actinocrispum wychmicini TaxID=1213861 RepID=A0A4R2JCG8_9PSEU|nr:alpha/beta hydrolase [Actinocrispum wychmicini]TCO57261.1 alpha-beta hydrolase superfamily lysophospholipase [Actinocrispum wychmicini]